MLAIYNRCDQQIQLFFRPEWRINVTLTVDCGMIVGSRQGGLSISETADLMGFSHTTVCRVCREWCKKLKKTCSEQQFCGQKHDVMREVRGEWPEWSKLTGR